jgi:hypothetical protein
MLRWLTECSQIYIRALFHRVSIDGNIIATDIIENEAFSVQKRSKMNIYIGKSIKNMVMLKRLTKNVLLTLEPEKFVSKVGLASRLFQLRLSLNIFQKVSAVSACTALQKNKNNRFEHFFLQFFFLFSSLCV